MKSEPIVFNRRQKENPWNGTVFNLPVRTLILRERTRSWWLSSGIVRKWFLWLRCREGRQINSDAYIRTQTDLRKRFKRVRPHNIPTGRTQIWKIGKTSQTLIRQWSSIQLAAPIQHLQICSYLEPEGYIPRYEVWDSWQRVPHSKNLIKWAEKGMVSTRYT
jgi:hypothetical protein